MMIIFKVLELYYALDNELINYRELHFVDLHN